MFHQLAASPCNDSCLRLAQGPGAADSFALAFPLHLQSTGWSECQQGQDTPFPSMRRSFASRALFPGR